mmetsp:Transcript_22348/g.56863  ORF Transcript_22348/g.56863 Transcript_22348/m.56863 type:complete len:320 (+) Transcript_22348:166-1125(+)
MCSHTHAQLSSHLSSLSSRLHHAQRRAHTPRARHSRDRRCPCRAQFGGHFSARPLQDALGRVGGEGALREGHEPLDRGEVLALGLVIHHVRDLALAQVLPALPLVHARARDAHRPRHVADGALDVRIVGAHVLALLHVPRDLHHGREDVVRHRARLELLEEGAQVAARLQVRPHLALPLGHLRLYRVAPVELRLPHLHELLEVARDDLLGGRGDEGGRELLVVLVRLLRRPLLFLLHALLLCAPLLVVQLRLVEHLPFLEIGAVDLALRRKSGAHDPIALQPLVVALVEELDRLPKQSQPALDVVGPKVVLRAAARTSC